MPNIASAKKRMRQNEAQRNRNRPGRSRLRSSLRKLNEAIEAGDLAMVRECWGETQTLLDRSAQAGLVHRNLAARTKARLAQRVNRLANA